jgi:hypothetical protein
MTQKWHETAQFRTRLAAGDKASKRRFTDLKNEWYAKAAKSGFYDIETDLAATGEPGPLLRGGPSSGDLARGLYRVEKEDYYRCARAHLHGLKAGSREAVVWEGHSNGMPETKILALMRSRRFKIRPSEVKAIIHRERAAMLAKSLEQDDSDEDMDPRSSDIAEVMLSDMSPPGIEILERGTIKRTK